MEMKEVQSSNIAAIGHGAVDADENTAKLTVRFSSGATYDYEKVPLEKIETLFNADSVGAYFAAYIRPNYKGVKQEDSE